MIPQWQKKDIITSLAYTPISLVTAKCSQLCLGKFSNLQKAYLISS